MLSKRQNNLVSFLKKQDEWKTGKQLAAQLQVTDRTIRSDIESINDCYGFTLIESNSRLGYRIEKKHLVRNYCLKNEEVLPQTSEERVKWLIQQLLFRSRKLNKDQIIEEIFISETSLENDIKKLRKALLKYPSLKLVRQKNMIFLEGDEIDKRALYKDMLTQETKGNFINLNIIADLWKDFDLLEVRDVLQSIMEKNNYEVRESVFPMIMIHAGVAIERIINHNYIKELNFDKSLHDNVEYKISKEFFESICFLLDIEVVDVEMDLFALLLLGKGSRKYYQYDKEYIDRLIDDIFEEIKSYFGIDFSHDNDLRIGLTTHLCSLMERQKNNMKVANLYLKQIKKNYPLVFEMSVHAGEVISRYTNNEVNENELAFLALHLGTAYDRLNTVHKYRAVTIIPHGHFLSKTCVDKLNMRFNSRMDIIATLSYFEKNEIQHLKPDLILTTAPLEHSLDIPTVNISLFISHEDESKVFQMLDLLDKKYYEHDFKMLLKRLMKKDLFKITSSATSAEDLICDMCDDLIAQGYSTEEYKKDVLKRESISATSFVYGIAIPHAISALTKESCIVTRILKKPVKWGEFDVRLVMLLGIHEVDSSLLKILFDSISEMVVNTNKFNRLLDVKSYEEYVRVILEQGE